MATTGTAQGASAGQIQLVRKCPGKNKNQECLQNAEHTNTRWECAFETQNKDEYLKHLKNIMKRLKWRELAEAHKEDKDGLYRCVYYSTDRHHVENHYHKGSTDPLTPSPQQVMRYKNYMQSDPSSNRSGKSGKRWHNFGNGKKDDDDDDEPEAAVREIKKLKQDASALLFLQEQHSMPEPTLERDQTTKVEDLMEQVEKKLEIPHEMAVSSVEKLHKHGYLIVSGLKGLSREGWEKIDLPLAVEEELKNQMYSVNQWAYGMVPLAWAPQFAHQTGVQYTTAWPSQYANTQGQVYYPYQTTFDAHDTVITEHDANSASQQQQTQDKEKHDGEKTEQMNVTTLVTAVQAGAASYDSQETNSQPQENNSKADTKSNIL